MNIAIIRSYKVTKNNDILIIHIGFKYYDIGFQIHRWGIRLMFVWWHLCIHFK